MLMLISNMSLLSFTAMLFLSTNPLSMGILILLMALSSTFIMSMLMSWWLGFLIFLIYVSGMLVLFSYFVAITPNIPTSTLTLNIFSLTVTTTIMMFMMMLPTNSPMMTIKEYYSSFFYVSPNNIMLMILVMLLLLTMIIVVKLITLNYGPLRPFLNKYV